MKSDLSRNTFDPAKHFSRVLLQQGRVTLDTDWNEQADILLRYLRVLAADLIGPHGGPKNNVGFNIIAPKDGDFAIGEGRYYVDGLLCEIGEGVSWLNQADLPFTKNEVEVLKNGLMNATEPQLVYVDVWERNITSVEDKSIREVALGGPDTAARTKVVQQVKIVPLGVFTNDPIPNKPCPWVGSKWHDWVEKLRPEYRGALTAQVEKHDKSSDPCVVSPASRYRGPENQLYRVEVHKAGSAWDGDIKNLPNSATFKWSRENGSVVFPILKIKGDSEKEQTTVHLEHLGRDAKLGLQPGDWVEVVNDHSVLQNAATPLLQVQSIDPDAVTVTLDGETQLSDAQCDHPLLRRWDQRETELCKLYGGVVPIKEDKEKWFDLEDGVQIQFAPPDASKLPNQYRTGDYWLIPARVATGDVEWPRKKVQEAEKAGAEKKCKWVPESQPPLGVDHHYAPLAIIAGTTVYDLRRHFEPRAVCISP